MPGWFLGRDIDPAGLHWSWRLWGSIPHVGFAGAPGWFRGRDLCPWRFAFVHGDPWGSIPRIGLEAGMNGDWWTAWEDDEMMSMKSQGYGYKRISAVLDRTRDAVRSRYREMIGQGRETRRESRAIGASRAGWLARRRGA